MFEADEAQPIDPLDPALQACQGLWKHAFPEMPKEQMLSRSGTIMKKLGWKTIEIDGKTYPCTEEK